MSLVRQLLQECPTGVVKEDTFKDIYAHFFPQGGQLTLLTVFCTDKNMCGPMVDSTPYVTYTAISRFRLSVGIS